MYGLQQLMIPSGSRATCRIWQKLLMLDLSSLCTDPAQHLTTTDAGSTVDCLYDLCDLYDLYDLYWLYDLALSL